ncbi:MAG: hypothetical protein ACO1N8_05475 [Methylophilus sp.]
MKFSIILATLISISTSTAAFAECNTVMGGCVKDEAVNVSPHMHAGYEANAVVKDKAKASKDNKKVTAETKTSGNSKKL